MCMKDSVNKEEEEAGRGVREYQGSSREQNIWSLTSHGKKFRFYSKCNDKSFKNLKQENDMIRFKIKIYTFIDSEFMHQSS